MRLLGAFAAAPPASVVRPARRLAMLGLLLMAATGFVLFAAEASHVAMNRVFQIKAVLIGLGILNALLVARRRRRRSTSMPAFAPLPARSGWRRGIAGDLAVGGGLRALDRVFLTRARVRRADKLHLVKPGRGTP